MIEEATAAKLLERIAALEAQAACLPELEAQVARIPELTAALEAKSREVDDLSTRLRHVEAYRAKLVREVESLREENTILKDKVREL
ncbi:MAG: hypothetical protein HMLKMBBP_03439 [Planctomycetes bacterium]|nr:hypothetical protein [Planctomycetota bacterium]